MRWRILSVLLLAPLATGCVRVQFSITPRTALEQALLSEAALRSLAGFKVADLEGKSFFLNPLEEALDIELVEESRYKIPDTNYLHAAINRALLKSGMVAAMKRETADIIVSPLVAQAGIDTKVMFFGSPPVSLSGFGSFGFSVPRLTLFYREKHLGRNQMSAYGVFRESGELAFEIPRQVGEVHYTLYEIFWVINFDTTDLTRLY